MKIYKYITTLTLSSLLILFSSTCYLNPLFHLKETSKDNSLLEFFSLFSLIGSSAETKTPPSSLTYTGSPYTFTQNAAITTQTPTVTGTITSCTANPSLPTGLSLDTTTCAISGTPTVIQAATDYTITTSNASGNTTAVVSITVNIPTVATPTFSPATGHYNTAQNISISTTTSGATVYFSTDGTTPTASSTLYSATVHIWSLAGKTIKALATKAGFTDSVVATLSGMFSYPPLKSGQTIVFTPGDNGTNQTGSARGYTGPTALGTYTSDYTTTDTATGLVWKTCTQGLSGATCATGTALTMNWTDAASGANGCTALNSANSGNGYAEIKTWRLPSRQELETLPDYGKATSPRIDTTAFPATVASFYWSSTTYAPNTTNAWNVNFDGGGLGINVKTNTSYVRCVSGSPKEYNNNFTDNGDGTVKDNATGLIWQKCSQGQGATDCSGTATTAPWANAITYCSGLSLAGKTWRLPQVNELKTIVDTTKASGATIDTTAFPLAVALYYWSSTTYAAGTTDAWYFGFYNGDVVPSAKTGNGYVRCVSGP